MGDVIQVWGGGVIIGDKQKYYPNGRTLNQIQLVYYKYIYNIVKY